MTITYYGHSAFQIETGGTTLLFDPYITDNPHAEGVVTPDDLNPDVILLTHAHFDHWGDTPDIMKRANAQVVANFDIIQYIQNNYDHENVLAMGAGGWWDFGWGRVKLTYARHSSSFPDGAYGGNPNGFILHLEGKCVYNTGDTCPFSEMQWTGDDHDIDVALMPVGDYFTMGTKDAVRAAKMLRPSVTVPLHYDTFPAIELDTGEWARAMSEAGLETRVMAAGETYEL